MSRIITITLKPSLDRTMITRYLNPGYHNLTTEPTRLDPAGHGVSIARGLHRLGVATNAVILLGNDATARAYRALIEAEAIPVTLVPRSGTTHSHIIIKDTGAKTETHIVEESSVGTEADLEAVIEVLRGVIGAGDTVVMAGALMTDAPPDTYARLTNTAHALHATTVVIASGDPLNRALRTSPETVVIRRREMEALFNFPIRTEADVVMAARKVLERGTQRVVVTMGGDQRPPLGVLVTPDQAWMALSPEAEIGTISGVNDAFVTGYLWGVQRGDAPDRALCLAAAAATFAATQVGHEFGTPEDVEALLPQVTVTDNIQ